MSYSIFMSNTVENGIARDPGVCGGAAVIAGTRITVKHIAIENELMGRTPDEIITAHPHLNLAQIHEALAYYFRHKSEIDTEIREDEDFFEKAAREMRIVARA